MLKKQDHTHTFRRHTFPSTGNKVFFCTDDKCSYKIDVSLSLGKLNICNRCGNPFKMDHVSIRQAKPHCRECDRRRVKDEDGATRYVNPETVVKEIAADRVSSLADRMKAITSKEDDVEL